MLKVDNGSEPKPQIPNLWDEAKVAGMGQADLLLYRSNLLGSDMRVTNYGGGNTSAKFSDTDPLTGEQVDIMWVKGSGGDIGTMKLDGFSTLYMDKLQSLKNIYRGPDYEDEMVAYLPHCTFALNTRAASIDTPLHGFVPKSHVDHVHPDAIIAIAASSDSKQLTKEIYGDTIGWLPWRRPGFELGLMIEAYYRENPNSIGCILESHGLFTWADDAKTCYDRTLDTINIAINWLEQKSANTPAFGGVKHKTLAQNERLKIASSLMPEIRGRISTGTPKVGHFDGGADVLEFVNSANLQELAALGTSCPDHFLRTKIRPLIIELDSNGTATNSLDELFSNYRNEYAAYYAQCKHDNSPAMRDPNAVVYLIPGVGMITFAANKATARISAEFYKNAIHVMKGASAVSTYQGLPLQEAFDIEYWLLEEAKLQRLPKAKPLAGQIALVTGGAGGIGHATATRLLSEGAAIMLTDKDPAQLSEVAGKLANEFGSDQIQTAELDVTDENSVIAAMEQTCLAFGGIDILVSNAGIVTGDPIDETSLATWQLNMDVLATGYFLVAREVFKIMKTQSIGGSIVFIASKNGLAASQNAAAYCTAKAAEIHLSRCIALEGAPHGIRANVVNPDGVLRGSRMWDDARRKERAEAYGLKPEELDDHYRKRSLLKRSVYPEDIAEAVAFLAGDKSYKSTGNIINVDGGNAQSFTR